MQPTNIKRHSTFRRRTVALAAVATIAQIGAATYAGTTPGEITISTSGSTALKNWFTGNTFTDVNPGTFIQIAGVTYPTDPNYWANGGSLYQIAPKNNQTVSGTGVADTAAAVRLEYHESGSVEGILELANDQIAPVTYVTQNINRDPSTLASGLGGNAVWVNYTQFGAKGQTGTWNPNGTGSTNGSPLGDFYTQSNPTPPYTNPNLFVLGGSAQPTFNLSGGNLYGGQNAVQLALSDAVPVQVFAADNTTATSSTPWTLTPQDAGYGQGNTHLQAANLGTPNLRASYQSATYLNMPTTLTNPRTGTAFTSGPWNTAELGNLTSTTIASTATLFVANPGTGLTQVNRGDAQFLETTGRLANGAMFEMSTRDVNSGTRNVAALDAGIDPTWAVGVNDNGNGNANDASTNQVTIGAGFRYSNKTAGGNELRPTVQAARMSVGTLSINDANGNAAQSKANPVRALAYSDSLDGSAPYVPANYFTIAGVNTSNSTYSTTSYSGVNPNGQQYALFQNEQAVTLKAPNSNYSTGSPDIQGDTPTADTKSLLNNTFSSVSAAFQSSTGSSVFASPVTGLLSNGYIPPQLMAVEKAQNGLSNVSASAVSANPVYDPTNFLPSNSAGYTAFGNLVGKLTNDPAASVTTGAGSVYGGNSLVAGGPSFGQNSNGTLTNSLNQIPITSTNYLFGNFNKNGVRGYDAVVVEAQKAQAALEPFGTSAYQTSGGSLNSTPVVTGTPLDSASPTKGDLIVLGDYNGDGKFDGKDLYLMAVGASLSSSGSFRPTESGSTFTTGTINASGSTFATNIATSVLNKNVALDYLQANATATQKAEAAEILVGSSNASSAVPAGAIAVGFDAVSGNVQFTFDSAGTNAFNKADVNQDGVVDMNDALAVDALNGKDYTSLTSTLTSYEPSPVTGTPELADLVLATQIDVNADGTAHTVVGSQDLAAVNTALTGVGTSNWYNYSTGAATKTGPGTITFNRSGGTVNLYTGAGLAINAGTIQILSTLDPFTSNGSTGTASSLADTTKSLNITVATGGTLQYSGSNNVAASGIQVDRLGSLNISGGSVVIDPANVHANRTVLVTGALSITGTTGKLDLGDGALIAQGSNLTTISNYAKAGFNRGAWNGASGITSAKASADSGSLTAVGVIQSTGGIFQGVPTTAADVLAKFTYYGDANLDGLVDGSDYSKIDNGYLNGLTGWANGDFNYDGVVNGSDYTLIDNAYNSQGQPLALIGDPTAGIASQVASFSSGAGASSAVPEPTTLSLLGLGAIGLLGRRRVEHH